MLVQNKLLISLVSVGVAGGTGGGVYYAITKKDVLEDKKQKVLKSLIFKKVKKDGEDKEIYEGKLEDEENNLESEECKFENDVLKCKIPDSIDSEKIQGYLDTLNKSLKDEEVTSDKTLIKKLKDKLTENGNFKKIFGEEIYKNIEDALKDVE